MKHIADTKEKRTGLVVTIVVHAILLLLFFLYGLTYMDPPPQPGIAINFGTSDVGQGKVQPKPARTQPKPQPKVEEKVVEKPVEKPAEKTPKAEEQMMTQDTEEAPVTATEKKKPTPKKEAKKEEKKEEKKETPKPVEKAPEPPKPSKSTTNALSNLLNKPEASGGEGNDNKPGDKGKVNGDPNASAYNGNGGIGNHGNYSLGGRDPRNKPQPTYDGNDQGIVVVRILVDRNGRVFKAEAGVKGTTVTDRTLWKRAEEAALKTIWEPKADAPARQEGKIIYNFSIRE